MLLKVEHDTKAGFEALVAAQDIPSGTLLGSISGEKIVAESQYNTVHIGEYQHLVLNDELVYTNHCCRVPNARFVFTTQPWTFVALKDIRAGEWVTYDYATTEYVSGRSFECTCAAATQGQCRGRFDGFKGLSTNEKKEMIDGGKISPVVLKLHKDEKMN